MLCQVCYACNVFVVVYNVELWFFSNEINSKEDLRELEVDRSVASSRNENVYTACYTIDEQFQFERAKMRLLVLLLVLVFGDGMYDRVRGWVSEWGGGERENERRGEKKTNC